VQQDLQIVATYLQEPEYSPVWSCYIGLMVSRVATHTILSDASYAGIGGWPPDFNDLVVLGFNMKHINKNKQEPLDATTDGLHINPLEFLAAIINLWLILKLVVQLPANPTGYIIDLLSDNTSALSWMRLTAQTRDPRLQPLARITSTMAVSHNQPSPHPRSAQTHSRRRQLRSEHSESIREWLGTFVGARYLSMLPASIMPDLPSPA
jgi:hypothetical protein